jgi:hypothetical protein
MSEHSPEADRIDDAVVGGSESSIESDIAASGTDGSDAGVGANAGGAGDGDGDSHAADVAAGFDDPDDAPTPSSGEEDGSL